jgi:hypothetical protein
MTARRLLLLFALSAIFLVSACHRDPIQRLKAEPGVLAVVGRYYIQEKTFEAALGQNQVADTTNADIMSRIWDHLVNDVLILNDSVGSPVPVSPEPLERFADYGVLEDAASAALQQKVYSKVEVSRKEVERYYRDHLKEFRKGRGVLLREILLPGLKQAKEAEKLLQRGHSFIAVARLYSLSPEKGGEQYFEYQELPDYLRREVRIAKAGVPTRPIQVSAEFYQILLVVKSYERYTLPLQDVAPHIRLTISDAKGDQLLGAYMAGLRRRFKITVFWSKLPFSYRKETP